MRKFSFSIGIAMLVVATFSPEPLSATAPPSGGTISIEPAPAEENHDPATPSFVNAVGEALAAKGFTMLEDDGHAAYRAELIIRRTPVGTGSAKARTGSATAMPGGAYGSVGAGVTIPLPTGKSTLVPLQRIQLEVHVFKRGEQESVWRGSAVTVRAAGTRNGTDDVVARDLSQAVFLSYPAESKDVVGVP